MKVIFFLENLVGKNNVVYAKIHYDKNTQHMHSHFMLIVDEVRRKGFETYSNENIIYRENIDRNFKKCVLYKCNNKINNQVVIR